MRRALWRGGFGHCLGPRRPQRQIGGLHKQIRRWGTIDVLYLGVICVGSSEAGHPLLANMLQSHRGKHSDLSGTKRPSRRVNRSARSSHAGGRQPGMMGCFCTLPRLPLLLHTPLKSSSPHLVDYRAAVSCLFTSSDTFDFYLNEFFSPHTFVSSNELRNWNTGVKQCSLRNLEHHQYLLILTHYQHFPENAISICGWHLSV